VSDRLPVTVASAVGGRCTIVIRYARPTDGPALARLEGLSGRSLGETTILVAEADGELIAASPAEGGEVVTDPFRVALDVAELLRLRSTQLRTAA
jgi:hypothetical protein